MVLPGFMRSSWPMLLGTAALGMTALAGCAASSPPANPESGAGLREYEVFCMGSASKCNATAATFCRSRHGSPEFVVLRRIPERGALAIACVVR